MITQAQLKALVTYNPDTGNFTWSSASSGHNAGDIVGRGARPEKYILITIAGKNYNLHRLVFLYLNGELPASTLVVDHINGIPSDNRFSNLRLCTTQQNSFNAKPSGNFTTGIKGVSRVDRVGRLPHYKVRVGVGANRVQKCFTFTPETQQAMWLEANIFLHSLRVKLHGEFYQGTDTGIAGFGEAP